jgi:hypothetical protein
MPLWRMPLGRTTFRRMTHYKMTPPRLASNLMAFDQMPLTRINVKCESKIINKICSLLLSVILTFAVMQNVMAPCILHLFFSHLSWAQCYKTFLSVIYELSKQARVFVPGKLFQPSLIFEGKSGACPISIVSKRRVTRVASGFICKHLTRMDKIAKSKHSSLLRKFLNYVRKKFYNIDPAGLNKNFLLLSSYNYFYW